jgi:hypothetical protein
LQLILDQKLGALFEILEQLANAGDTPVDLISRMAETSLPHHDARFHASSRP